jgi:assimilatory nitrate reductase catalytic subunit
MHWGDRFLKGGVNSLTLPAFDPLSKQPELKHSGVRLERWLPWRLFALIEGDVQQHFETLRPSARRFPTQASASQAVNAQRCLYALPATAPDPQWLGISTNTWTAGRSGVGLRRPRRAIGKRVRIDHGRITAIRLAGKPSPNTGC